jgi:hypothetical protein
MIAGKKYIATPQMNASSSNIRPLLPYCYAMWRIFVPEPSRRSPSTAISVTKSMSDTIPFQHGDLREQSDMFT